jgi:DNA-binding HxlR family transcriptional regulator
MTYIPIHIQVYCRPIASSLKKAIMPVAVGNCGEDGMTRTSFANVDCGVAQAVEQIGDKWSIVILRSAFHGIKRFDEFSEHLGIAPNVLTNRLDKLVEADIFYRRRSGHDGRVVEYLLTPKGFDLYPMILFLNQWAERWMGKAEGARIEIVHRRTGRPIRTIEVLSEDGEALNARDTIMRNAASGSKVLDHSRQIISRRQAND